MNIATNPIPTLGTTVIFIDNVSGNAVPAIYAEKGDNGVACLNLKLQGFTAYVQPGSDLRRDVCHQSIGGNTALGCWLYPDEYAAVLAAHAAPSETPTIETSVPADTSTTTTTDASATSAPVDANTAPASAPIVDEATTTGASATSAPVDANIAATSTPIVDEATTIDTSAASAPVDANIAAISTPVVDAQATTV